MQEFETLELEAEGFVSHLIPLITNRMAGDVTVQVARKIREEIWPIDETFDTIKDEISAMEYSKKVAVTMKRQRQNAQMTATPGTT